MYKEEKILYTMPFDPNLKVEVDFDENNTSLLEDIRLEAQLRAEYYKRMRPQFEEHAQAIMDKYGPVFEKLSKT
jgi:hypothetical protein